jgi:hypothetical protein
MAAENNNKRKRQLENHDAPRKKIAIATPHTSKATVKVSYLEDNGELPIVVGK